MLGSLLKALADQYPRSSYQLVRYDLSHLQSRPRIVSQISKCGRYGLRDFDYSPATIRRSLTRTLRRLGTEYIDVLYLHDVEFVASWPSPSPHGADTPDATTEDRDRGLWGLGPGDEGKIWGAGDQAILAGYGELRKLREEGLVRSIGITGKSYIRRSRIV